MELTIEELAAHDAEVRRKALEEVKYSCTFLRQIYGTSDTELPPPLIDIEIWAVLSQLGDDKNVFSHRMEAVGKQLQYEAWAKPLRSNSKNDFLHWSVIELRRMVEAAKGGE